MPFAPGARLGPFEMLAVLDIPDLGELYRARDHEQGRDVTMRVVKADFGSNPDRLKRFDQEARAAVPLSHPNVLVVHDIGTDASTAYIVCEPMEGQTLRQVLASGALPVRRVIQYAVQIAHGLNAAHDKGIVHRDLKPENILIGAEGRVRVVGYGLATITQTESALMGLRGVSAGAALGTPAYMSPEQVRGEVAGLKSDMFAFGAIVYEMVTGTRAFAGETPLETMTAIGKSDPPKLSGTELPPVLARLVDLCLNKNAKLRPGADDAVRALHELWQQAPAVAAPTAPAPPPSPPDPVFERTIELDAPVVATMPRRRLMPIVIGVAVVALLVAGGPALLRILQEAWSGTVTAPSRPIATMTMPDRPVNEFALSPDGQRLAFTAVDGTGQRKLWVRSLIATGEQPLANTDGAASPFWSPDSRFIAYFAQGALRRVAAEGGMPTVVTDAASGADGAWSRDDVIVFAPDSEGGPLYQVAASGSTPSPLTGLESEEAAHRWPVFLPDGARFLFTVMPAGTGEPSVQIGSLESKARQTVLPNAARVALAEGYAIFIRDNALTVQPFDAGRLETVGDAIQVGSAPAGAAAEGVRAFSLSSAGVLAYQVGPASDPSRSRLAWFDRAGMEAGAIGEPADYGDVSLSPNGMLVAVSLREPGSDAADIVVLDVESGMRTPVTSDQAHNTAPVWSPDSRRILYSSTRRGTSDIYQKAATGTGNDAVIVEGQGDQIVYDWASDGRHLLYQSNQPGSEGRNFDLWARMLPGGPTFAYFRTVRVATLPKMSPDRQWVAYTSNELGREDVFVSRFPRPDGRRRMSARGGSWPRWRRDGEELFYLGPDNGLMAVPLKGGSPQNAGQPVPLFQIQTKPDRGYAYDVAADGQRFLVNASGEGDVIRPVTLVDWRARVTREP